MLTRLFFHPLLQKCIFVREKKYFSRFYEKIHIFIRKNEYVLQEKYSFYVCNIDIIRKKLLIFFSQNVVVFFWGGGEGFFLHLPFCLAGDPGLPSGRTGFTGFLYRKIQSV